MAAVQRETSYLEQLAAGAPLHTQDDPWQLETEAQVRAAGRCPRAAHSARAPPRPPGTGGSAARLLCFVPRWSLRLERTLPGGGRCAALVGSCVRVQVARYNQRHGEVMAAADTVFADAGEEFASLAAIKRRIEEFKHRCA